MSISIYYINFLDDTRIGNFIISKKRLKNLNGFPFNFIIFCSFTPFIHKKLKNILFKAHKKVCQLAHYD